MSTNHSDVASFENTAFLVNYDSYKNNLETIEDQYQQHIVKITELQLKIIQEEEALKVCRERLKLFR